MNWNEKKTYWGQIQSPGFISALLTSTCLGPSALHFRQRIFLAKLWKLHLYHIKRYKNQCTRNLYASVNNAKGHCKLRARFIYSNMLHCTCYTVWAYITYVFYKNDEQTVLKIRVHNTNVFLVLDNTICIILSEFFVLYNMIVWTYQTLYCIF